MTTVTLPQPAVLDRPSNGYHRPTPVVQPKRISLATYWETYYHDLDHTYEYNNGLLEEKPMARQVHADIFMWFSALLHRYFEAKPIGRVSSLEIGFQMPNKKQVRRPDLAIVLHSNSVPFEPLDMKYRGVFDVCVEAVSDSSRKEIDRDVVTKFKEYEAAGVKEYWLLSDDPAILGFYQLNPQGRYQAVPLTADGVWVSQVLPGFQLRRSDLLDLPNHAALVDDPVYAGYIAPNYQAERERSRLAEEQAEKERQRSRLAEEQAEQERQRAEQERQRSRLAEERAEQERLRSRLAEQQVEQERQRSRLAEQQAEQERQRAEQERQAKERLMEVLRQQGIDPATILN